MRAEVLSWCRREALFSPARRSSPFPAGRIPWQCSGCLRELAAELSVYVRAAHFNHRLRGAESDGDEAFVRAFCAAEGIELVCGAPEKPARSEEEAREQRYAFLDSIPCDAVAIAHTAEDNLEERCCSICCAAAGCGASAASRRRGRYARPLLAVSHAQAREYLRARGTGWREDATNAEDSCQRNRLRHGVLPLLAAEMPELPLRVTELTALCGRTMPFWTARPSGCCFLRRSRCSPTHACCAGAARAAARGPGAAAAPGAAHSAARGSAAGCGPLSTSGRCRPCSKILPPLSGLTCQAV